MCTNLYCRFEGLSGARTRAGQANRSCTGGVFLNAASWNVAAVNNNPFEFWVTYPDPIYDDLMQQVQAFLEDSEPVLFVHQIFTDQMFSELRDNLHALNIPGIEKLDKFWSEDYRNRLAVAEFIKDRSLGSKRLISMPDRITNTIFLRSGETCLRPTVINAYCDGSLDSVETWWSQWQRFMFRTHVRICDAELSELPQLVCMLIGPIQKSKYPAISEEEQEASIPLQILCLAILDAILVHIVNYVAPSTWEAVRKTLCDALIKNKQIKLCSILASCYVNTEVIFLQEAAAILASEVRQHPTLGDKFLVLQPGNMDGRRDQNSLILADRKRFVESSCVDVTDMVLERIDGNWVAPGDLLVVSIDSVDGFEWLLASFHGDSNGLMTQPLLHAISQTAREIFPCHVLVVGLDANTHSTKRDTIDKGVIEFMKFIKAEQLVSLWGSEPNLVTTCSSRTYLQPQLNKATPYDQRASAQQQSLKDWILVYDFQAKSVSNVCRDNTGRMEFIEGMVFPTTEYPSDHALVSARFCFDPTKLVNLYDPATQSEVGYPGQIARASEGSGHDAYSEVSSGHVAQENDGRARTLYDYWGISDKPAALEQARMEDWLNNTREAETQSARQASVSLDAQHLKLSKSNDRSIWLLFSSRCLSMAFTKVWFLTVLVLAMGSVSISAIASIKHVLNSRHLAGKHFRFTALELRRTLNRCSLSRNNCTHVGDTVLSAAFLNRLSLWSQASSNEGSGAPANISNPGIGLLGLQHNGADLELPYNVSVSEATMMITFGDRVLMNGWWFMTTTESVDDDAVRFYLERSLDGIVWKDVGYPPWLFKQGIANVPLDRNARKLIDLRPDWRWLGTFCVRPIVFLFMGLGSFVISFAGDGRRAVLFVASGYGLISSWFAICAFHDSVFAPRDESAAAFYLVQMFVAGFFCLMCYMERYVLDAIAFNYVAAMINNLVHRSTTRSSPPDPGTESHHYDGIRFHWNSSVIGVSLANAILMGTFLCLLIARHFIKKWVFGTLVAPDRKAYNDAWALFLIENDKSHRLLEKLRDIANRINFERGSSDLRQRQRRIATAVTSPSPCDLGLVRSLDLIFLHAARLDYFLKSKVKQLASLSKGCFPKCTNVDGNDIITYQRWDTLHKVHGLGNVRWAPLKTSKRALEKLFRSYDNDASRLLDCCRQSITFIALADLVTCLELIADKEIEIVQCKDRFDPAYDSKFSGGYRSVVLNLRIRSEATKRLGIDMHICELQLGLQALAQHMTAEAHRRYLILRNCRERYSLLHLLWPSSMR